MSDHLMTILLLLMSLSFPLVSSAQSLQPTNNSCQGFFYSSGIISAQSITNCKKLPTLGFEFGWSYSNTTTNITVDVVFSATPPPGGWVAWGVNPGKKLRMVGTRAIIAYVQPNGVPTMNTYNITGDTKRGCKLKPTALEVDVDNRKVNYSQGVITVAATLKLPPSTYNVSKLNMVWQMGPRVVGGDMPAMHATRLENFDSVLTINLTSGHSTGHQHQKLKKAHGVLSIIGWGFLLPMGVIISRYFRGFPWEMKRWFLVHVGFQILAYIIGTIAWGFGVTMGSESGNFHSFMPHRIIGILIFCLATLQMMALWLKPQKVDKYRKYWSIYHHFVGYTLIALVITNIFKGLAILRPPSEWKRSYIGVLGAMGSIALVLEATTWVRFSSKPLRKLLRKLFLSA